MSVGAVKTDLEARVIDLKAQVACLREQLDHERHAARSLGEQRDQAITDGHRLADELAQLADLDGEVDPLACMWRERYPKNVT